MKKILFLLAAVGMIFTACEPANGLNEDNNGNQTEQPGGGNDDAIPTDKIVIKPSTITVEAAANNYIVAVSSPCSWRATTEEDWITLETELGIDGKQQLIFAVKDYLETEPREGKIVVSNSEEGFSAELTVVQKAIVPAITIEPESLAFAVEGGTQEIAIIANFEYEFSTTADWLTVKKSEKGISVTAQNNVEVEERTAEITISKEKYGISKIVKATQGAFAPAITIEPESLAFTFEGGTQKVAIIANFEYEYSTTANWLTIEKSESGIKVTAKANANFEERTAEITISSEKYGVSKTIAVTQKGVSAESQNVIIYTSNDGVFALPYKSDVFGANIVSNTYGNGQGVIIFDAPVTSIGGSAFYECTSLTSVTIPNSVTSIGATAFSGCRSLTSVTIGDSVTEIGYAAFRDCTSLTSTTIGNSVTSIGSFAFAYCSSLTSVTIGNSVTSIGYEAFSYCTSLTSVTIPDSVTTIVDYAFRSCYSLTSVTIGNSVTSIGKYTFSYCSSLTSVYCKPLTPPAGGYHYFDGNASGRKIYVPRNSVEAYKSADGWKDYADYIEGYDF